MAGTRERGRAIRDYIVAEVGAHPDTIAQLTAARFGISRQAISRHLHRLVADGLLIAQGATRNRRYALAVLEKKQIPVPLTNGVQEDAVWRTQIQPLLANIPQGARDIWQYGFTEMLNNAIDHSSGTIVIIVIERTAATVQIQLLDDGEGIFRKIARELQLDDKRYAVLELAKGKLTTDPENHTGEGIFFTSRLFDQFEIYSDDVFFSHSDRKGEDWILDARQSLSGTMVRLQLNNNTTKTAQTVFDEYTTDGDYGFSKTVVPVRLVQFGDEALVSRSQAKRLLARFDRFQTVVLNFEGVERVGQAFADEVFRVFTRGHPEVSLVPLKMNRQIRAMIRRSQNVA